MNMPIDSSMEQRAEDAVREQEAELSAIYENAPLIMLLVDSDRIIRKANRFAQSFADAVGDELIGIRPGAALRCMHALENPLGCGFGTNCQHCSVRRILLDTLETGRSHQQVEARQQLFVDGRLRNATVLLSTARISAQGEHRVLITMLDISERKEMEDKLRLAHDELEQRVNDRTSELAGTVNALLEEIDEREKAEEALERTSREFEDLYNQAPCGYHSLDKDGVIVRINDSELRWLGYSRDEVVGKMKVNDIMTPESRIVFADNFSLFKKVGVLNDLRLNYIRKDGSILPGLLNATAMYDHDGSYLMSRSTMYDISDLVRAEERLRRLNRLYQTLSETNHAIVRVSDRENLFNETCRIAVEYGGFMMAWVGLTDEVSGFVRPVAAFGSGTAYLDRVRITVREEPAGLGPTGTAIREGGYYVCNDFANDSRTAPWRSEAEQLGIRSSASFALKLNGKPVGAITMYAGEEHFFDAQMVELLRQMATDISFALDNLDREARRRVAEQALHEETIERLRAMEALREKEQLLMQQGRLAAMGEMIGNIAHQWRQPLNMLGLVIQELPVTYDLDCFDKEYLEASIARAMQIIFHMSHTIDDFRNFFRPDKEKVTFKVNDVVLKTIALVEPGFKEQRVVIDFNADGDVFAEGYPNEYAQVLLNILLNARDALQQEMTREPKITIGISRKNERAVVTIGDNAGGIPEDIINKVFEPYFTTKGPDKGTGVGLYMAKTIIEKNMCGSLSVQNTGAGAEFRIEV
jgi:PAS domain S-box-containing protein